MTVRGRTSGRRQIDAFGPDPALLRRYLGCDPRGRDRPARIPAGQPAQPHGHRHAGDDPVQRHDRGQHPPRQTRRDGRRSGSPPHGWPTRNGSIRETEHGYDTNVGDRGMKLSGGQRQRLSIARAVLKNPDILTPRRGHFGLDTEIRNRKLVQEALGSLLKGRTSLVIAHRLSTIVGADKIIRDRARPHRRTGYAPRIDGARRHLRTPDRNAATRVKPSRGPRRREQNASGANSNTDSLRFPATFLYL